jgi:hypothetical protein
METGRHPGRKGEGMKKGGEEPVGSIRKGEDGKDIS